MTKYNALRVKVLQKKKKHAKHPIDFMQEKGFLL